jgi:hypothetical protein
VSSTFRHGCVAPSWYSVMTPTPPTFAVSVVSISASLHDLTKFNCFQPSWRPHDAFMHRLSSSCVSWEILGILHKASKSLSPPLLSMIRLHLILSRKSHMARQDPHHHDDQVSHLQVGAPFANDPRGVYRGRLVGLLSASYITLSLPQPCLPFPIL